MRAAWQQHAAHSATRTSAGTGTGSGFSASHRASAVEQASGSSPYGTAAAAAGGGGGAGGGGAAPTAWWRSQQGSREASHSAYTGTAHAPEPAPLRSRPARGSALDSDAKAAAPMPQPAFSGLPHPLTPPSSSLSATTTSEPGSGGSVRRVAVGRGRGAVSQAPQGYPSVSSDPQGRHNPKEFGADLSDVSIGGVARAAGAPAMAAANPYLKPDWRSASASAPSAYLA